MNINMNGILNLIKSCKIYLLSLCLLSPVVIYK